MGSSYWYYKSQIVTDWKEFTQEMLNYCIQDVEVTATLYQILTQSEQPQALELEHEVAKLFTNKNCMVSLIKLQQKNYSQN